MTVPGHSDLVSDARELILQLRAKGLMMATAESCTGGLISAFLTEVAGSSHTFERGFVTYSNAAKHELLGVPEGLIKENGAVSEPVVRAMAEGALAHSKADVSVAVTGIAGPGGGTATKPVGLVHIAAKRKGAEAAHRKCTFGDVGREGVRRLTVAEAFVMVRSLL
jgi:nicotinamide-nucleotide amidase